MNELEKPVSNSVVEIKSASPSQLEMMGGKAGTLAKLLQKSFPVPPGISVLSYDLQPQEWQFLQEAALRQNLFPVAVRSSAQGEDGSEVSYAGQFKTFLNVTSGDKLVAAVKDCFDSVQRASSKSYAAHFDREEIPMRVFVQKMIEPQFSGVYFSHDPRNQSSGWMIETVEGLGEKLVSAQVTPHRFFEKPEPGLPSATVKDWKESYTKTIAEWAHKVELALNYQIDMEWAIDQKGQFWILQVRPITTAKASLNVKKILSDELTRLQQEAPADTVWDGHSFAELSGVPSELTFDLWKEAFAPEHAFDLALKDLGYTGMTPTQVKQTYLLERVFGRSYLNLKHMEPMYFGGSPYRIVPLPRPHLEFEFKRLNFGLLLKAPAGIFQMIKVAWKIQTQRKDLAKKAARGMNDGHYDKLGVHEIYAEALKRAPTEQLEYIKTTYRDFAEKHLQGTFLITLLIESTTQGILAILTKDLGESKAHEEAQHFMGENLKTISTEMSQALIQAHDSKINWDSFISQFGHRGLGELELSQPRWIETAQAIRTKRTPTSGGDGADKNQNQKSADQAMHREQILSQISGLRRPLLVQELEELQGLLRVREQIKMHVMKPYADIRWSLIALAKSLNKLKSSDDIFWLRLPEIEELTSKPSPERLSELLNIIQTRKETAKIFKSVEVPMSVSASDLADILSPESSLTNSGQVVLGVSLSPGIASGVVHIVENPELEDIDKWPENTILVAEATDPGWTPLFGKAKAVIVSRGGILSHCAIVAREMGLPAVGEVLHANQIFKEGEYVWVDGIHGTIRRRSSSGPSPGPHGRAT